MDNEYSNPIAPVDSSDYYSNRESDSFAKPMAPPPSQRLTNNDFRRLLLTPRPNAVDSGSAAASSGSDQTNASSNIATAEGHAGGGKKDADNSERRKKRKAFFAQRAKQKSTVKNTEEGGEIVEDSATPSATATPYRDRAKERREGKIPAAPEPETLANAADYRAVAPAAPGPGGVVSRVASFAERRRQLIEESKYLGGDMEHTHLVKGLDYSLLEKVRQEIQDKEREGVEGGDDMDLVQALEKAGKELDAKAAVAAKSTNQTAQTPQFQTRIARNIHKLFFEKELPTRNDLFAPGRMAYRVDLSEEWAEFDVPATIIRSKADCPALVEGSWGKDKAGSTTQERIVSRIIEILAFLRVGRRQAKKLAAAKRAREEAEAGSAGDSRASDGKRKLPGSDMPLYDDVGEYRRPEERRRERERDHQHRSGRDHHDRGGRREDADRSHNRDRDHRPRETKNRERERDREDHRSDYRRDRREREREHVTSSDKAEMGPVEATSSQIIPGSSGLPKSVMITPQDVEAEKKKERERLDQIRRKTETTGYDECYPGFVESFDAMGDSDDETDYTKMDLGNRKGPVGRWDFDSVEEYSNYMSSREALPKAAFQYGVKMSDGRKTRRPEKASKEDVNRQWQQIQSMMQNKRKSSEGGVEDSSKRAKY